MLDGQQELELVFPDAEVIIRISGSDVATVAFFAADDGTMDVLLGIDNAAHVDNAMALLQDAQLALHGASWVSVAELVERSGETVDGEEGTPTQDDIPF